MRQPVVRTILGAITALALVAAPVWAHHSSAMFDQSRSLVLDGVVTEFRWMNPHAFIQMSVKGDEGLEEEWSIEMNSPESLARAGWQPETLRAGDAVTLVVHPARDDTKSGQYLSGAGPRGPLIDSAPPAPSSAQTLSPSVVTHSCPRVDLTLVEPGASAETRPVKLGGDTVFVRRDALTTTRDISEIKLAGDDVDTSILIKYKPEAAARLLDATTDHDGLRLAFVVDDDVWLAFTWRGPYGIGPDGTQLSIQNGLAKAQGLMDSIRDCSSR
jgi:uncharacterized protein DUF6152